MFFSGPDAKNGGTSYPGFCRWIEDGMPMGRGFLKYEWRFTLFCKISIVSWLKHNRVLNG